MTRAQRIIERFVIGVYTVILASGAGCWMFVAEWIVHNY